MNGVSTVTCPFSQKWASTQNSLSSADHMRGHAGSFANVLAIYTQAYYIYDRLILRWWTIVWVSLFSEHPVLPKSLQRIKIEEPYQSIHWSCWWMWLNNEFVVNGCSYLCRCSPVNGLLVCSTQLRFPFLQGIYIYVLIGIRTIFNTNAFKCAVISEHTLYI